MEVGDISVGDVVWLLASAVCELPSNVQDITLVGEESGVPASLLVENGEVDESRVVGCSPLILAGSLVLGQCSTSDPLDCCLSKPFEISSTRSKAST